MVFLDTVNNLLEHIKEVETDTIELSRKSQLQLTKFIESHKLPLDDETAEAMQYQDIISQQLTATIEAIQEVQESIRHFNHAFQEDEAIATKSVDKMQNKLTAALEQAQQKRDRFAGKTGDAGEADDGIEFF
jgi:maltodextrin utilization protein YvdJ